MLSCHAHAAYSRTARSHSGSCAAAAGIHEPQAQRHRSHGGLGRKAHSEVTTGRRTIIVLGQRSGAGLPAGNIDQIFSAFFTTKVQGSGMGLAISRSIVESHGGRWWAIANDGRGATFHFTCRSRSRSHRLWLPETLLIPAPNAGRIF